MEAQQAEADEESSRPHLKLSSAEAATCREKENLRLARQQVLQQMKAATNPRHRTLLQDALADLDAKLNGLET